MSRFFDEGYDEDPTPYELRYANYQRALQGRRGQQALRDLRDAIRAMPVPRLIEGAVCRTGEAGPEFCAVGLLVFGLKLWLWHRLEGSLGRWPPLRRWLDDWALMGRACREAWRDRNNI